MHNQAFKIFNSRKEPIRGDVSIPDLNKRFPVIILCHGFKGFKDWAFFPFLAEMLCKKGFIVVKFNFSGSGIGEDLQNFTDPDRFAANTYSKELEDLQRVLDELERGNICGKAAYLDRIGLFGHSRGGGIAVLQAAHDKRIRSLVTWSPICRVDRQAFLDVLPQWKRSGHIDIPNTRTGQVMKLNLDIVDDIEKHAKTRLNILQSAARVRVPFLIVHADQDESVPLSEGRTIHQHVKSVNCRLEIINGTGHTYGAVHPFAGSNSALKKAVQHTREWFIDGLR